MDNPRPIKLQSLVYRDFLRSALIPLLVIELLLLALYFGISSYISDKNQSTLVSEVRQSLSEITSGEALRINQLLQEVARSARMLQIDHQLFFNSNRCFLPNGKPEFATHPNGAFYKVNPVGSSLYYSSSTEIGEQEINKAMCSESLDPLLQSVVETNPAITQAYINTWDNMNRLYPFMTDAPAQYGPTLELQEFNFYYDADEFHNPGRKNVWTEVYLDPAGQGWMLSNLVPVYRGDVLEGVSGVDVTVASFIDNILNHHLPWESVVLVIDENGTIIAMQENAEHLFGIKELKSHQYDSNVTQTVKKPKQYNFYQLPGLPQEVTLLGDSSQTLEVSFNDRTYIADSKLVPETGWRIITMVNTDAFLAPINTLKMLSDTLGQIAILIMVIFYVIFFIYLRSKSKKLAARIAEPIEALTIATGRLRTTWDADSLADSSIEEIQKLNLNFQRLFSQLQSRTEELLEAIINFRVQKKEKKLLKKLALTDALTGIPNRLRLDQVLNAFHQSCQADDSHYGVLLLDIDHFKSINDNYGHQIGDLVLKEVASLLQDNIKAPHVVGRWGGEEFLIVCALTDKGSLFNMGNSLRTLISQHNFASGLALTTSVGVAIYQQQDDIETLISRADQALYQAKNGGRDKVVA